MLSRKCRQAATIGYRSLPHPAPRDAHVFEILLATLVLIACLVLLVRLMLPPAQRARLDATGRRTFAGLRAGSLSAWEALSSLRHRTPKARQDAARTAEEVIRRAREGQRPPGKGNGAAKPDGEWDGNVYRPKSFKPPRKPH